MSRMVRAISTMNMMVCNNGCGSAKSVKRCKKPAQAAKMEGCRICIYVPLVRRYICYSKRPMLSAAMFLASCM
jgi:hypothetical protein